MFKKHKYNAVKTEIDWITFSSKLEARFYKYFIDNDIKVLELQPPFILQDKFRHDWKAIREIKYIPDFKIEYNGDIFYVDSKWMSDAIFKMKHKMWLKRYGGENTLIIAKSIKNLLEQIN